MSGSEVGFFDAAGVRLSGSGRGIAMRQSSPATFRIEETFTYRTNTDEWTVTPEMLGDTDLASVPWPMLWFLPRYGRHTLAALLHDSMVKTAGDDFTSRRFADRVFFGALGVVGVPTLMRLIMWAAVTIATRWRTADRWRRVRRLGLIGWSVAAIWGIANFVTHLAWWDVGPLGRAIIDLPPPAWSGWWASMILPAVVAPLWGRDAWPQGLGAIVPGAFVVPMSALTAIAYGLYWLIELGVTAIWGQVGPEPPEGADPPPRTPPGARETLS